MLFKDKNLMYFMVSARMRLTISP